MLSWSGVEVLNNVVALSFEQVVVVILYKIVLDLLSTDPSSVLPVDSAECCVWLEGCQLPKGLSLPLNSLFFFCNCQHQVAQPWSYNWWKFFIIAFSVAFAIASPAVPILCMRKVVRRVTVSSIIVDWLMSFYLFFFIIKLSWWPQWGQPTTVHMLCEFRNGVEVFILILYLYFFSH